MPAAQVKGTRDNFCFFTMSGPNRRSRNQESMARSPHDPPNRDQEDQAYQNEDSEYDEPQSGYTARKSREFPVDSTLRIQEERGFRVQEDHHEFSFSCRQECQWYQDKEMVRLLRRRGNPPIFGPRDMSIFTKKQILMDAVSWNLYWEKRHGFAPFTTFNELGPQNPTQCHMSPRDFAAMLICNDKQRFQISVYVNWTWKPFGFPPTQPWDLRMGAVQGHSNSTVNPYDFPSSCSYI